MPETAAGPGGRRIGLLSPDTIAGISAGEVIERPASVVKELVENSIDAGAKRVRVEIEGAGMRLIRVSDDGHGIPPAEVALAFARHATSKLRELEDLARMGTFGFRGEALAAIAAAGKVEMATRVPGAKEGVRATGGGGSAMAVKPAGCETGTVVTIRKLFGAVPARLKFLKSPSAETSAVARVIEPYAMTHLDVHFVFVVDGEERLNAPGTTDEMARIRAVLGSGDIALVAFDRKAGGVRAHGFVESPGAVQRRGRQWFHVNRRPIEDRALRHAVISSYEGQLPRDTQPWAVVFVEVGPEQVDVNVHPAKAEVRFADPQAVYAVLREGLRECFGRVPGSRPGAAAGPSATGAPPAGLETGGVAEPLAAWAEVRSGPGEEVEVLGQAFRTYIVARTREGVLFVDQHTAHEKIIFERLQAGTGTVPSQGLLVPQTIDLSPSEFALAEGNAEVLRSLGIAFDAFGGRSIVVRQVPAEASDGDVSGMLRWLLEDLEAAGRAPSRQEIEKKLLSTVACHLAVRSGDPLERGEMDRIVRDLLALNDPRTCPHGRPTFVLHAEGDLARLFHRSWGLGKRECH